MIWGARALAMRGLSVPKLLLNGQTRMFPMIAPKLIGLAIFLLEACLYCSDREMIDVQQCQSRCSWWTNCSISGTRAKAQSTCQGSEQTTSSTRESTTLGLQTIDTWD